MQNFKKEIQQVRPPTTITHKAGRQILLREKKAKREEKKTTAKLARSAAKM